ncbi:son RNA binding protein isoform X2 [Leptinotarsa decemlineata]|uniref:son RNA binding protein isoform X2 n=1 Tax=Leptinotarsa decemlineata TaxID=7539 RepID=UPI003D30CF6C
MSEEIKEEKPELPIKSSMEILSELFSTFHAKPPIIIKKEKSDNNKKHKKKKKHKHKDKKHKKKDKKKRHTSSSSSDNDEVDLAKILIKNEKSLAEKKIKVEGNNEKDVENNIEEEGKEEKKDSRSTKKIKSKIFIKDLKLSSIFESTIQEIHEKIIEQEEGEASESDSSSNHKKKKHKSKSKKRSRSSSDEHRKKKMKTDDSKVRRNDSRFRDRSKERRKHRERSRDRSRSRERRSQDRDSRMKDTHRERKHISRDRDEYSRELEDYKRSRNKISDDGFYKPRESNKEERENKWFMRDRYRGYNERDRNNERNSESRFDKKKLLEIARKNAITMMKSGSLPAALTLGPQAQEKVIAAIKSGGKTIEELTDFCKTLSKKEELGELSSLSEKDDSDSDPDKPFHHPFQLKDRPTSITMNIKNSVPLPIKSSMERTSELRIQFPVSSGQQHRKGEEWMPVSPPAKKTDNKPPLPVPPPTNSIVLPIEPTPVPLVAPPVVLPKIVTVSALPNAPPGPQVFPTPVNEPTADIGSIVSQRLTAIRRLQENPHDVQALTQMYKSNKEMQSWATSKQQLGQFTGSTGAQILSQAELSSGYQAWAKKANKILNKGPTREVLEIHGINIWINFKLLLLYQEVWECISFRKWVGDPEKVWVKKNPGH